MNLLKYSRCVGANKRSNNKERLLQVRPANHVNSMPSSSMGAVGSSSSQQSSSSASGSATANSSATTSAFLSNLSRGGTHDSPFIFKNSQFFSISTPRTYLSFRSIERRVERVESDEHFIVGASECLWQFGLRIHAADVVCALCKQRPFQ